MYHLLKEMLSILIPNMISIHLRVWRVDTFSLGSKTTSHMNVVTCGLFVDRDAEGLQQYEL